MYRKLSQLTLALFTVAATSIAAQAQDIKYHCKVRGYSGWVRVDPGCNSGGRVIRTGSGFVTDRVMRGEPLQVTLADSRDRCRIDLVAAFVSSNGRLQAGAVLFTPFVGQGVCPTNVNADNVEISLTNLVTGRQVSRRIPIGTR